MTTSTITAMRKGDPQHMLRERMQSSSRCPYVALNQSPKYAINIWLERQRVQNSFEGVSRSEAAAGYVSLIGNISKTHENYCKSEPRPTRNISFEGASEGAVAGAVWLWLWLWLCIWLRQQLWLWPPFWIQPINHNTDGFFTYLFSFINGFFILNSMATKGRRTGKYTENTQFKKKKKLQSFKLET